MESIVKMYFGKFSDRGFITFTIIGKDEKEFLDYLGEAGIKYRICKYNTFIAVSLIGKIKKKAVSANKNNK